MSPGWSRQLLEMCGEEDNDPSLALVANEDGFCTELDVPAALGPF